YDLAKHHGEPATLTHFNDEFLKSVKISEPEDLWLDTPDKTKLHVWVMKPIGALSGKRYPAVLEIHGGRTPNTGGFSSMSSRSWPRKATRSCTATLEDPKATARSIATRFGARGALPTGPTSRPSWN